ncbi:hypothetical protein [Marinicellulosiphila megalodicopiae]|uniref:hypothetical protein n=1 Tax=Marinicellulosiphila megalodicopiae TaxID=2724896 RepID=UPI003BB1E957
MIHHIHKYLRLLPFIILIFLCGCKESQASGALEYEIEITYSTINVQGFTIKITESLMDNSEYYSGVSLLHERLAVVVDVLPKSEIDFLKQNVIIWITDESEVYNIANVEYHKSAQWLINNNLNPDKAKGIEIHTFNTFIEWTKDQPFMLLHELAHAYQHQYLGDDNAKILSAFNLARDSGIYEEVDRNGVLEKAYAIANEFEYFAETSESFFVTNDYFPYNRDQLKSFDNNGYLLMLDIWGVVE